MAKRKVLGATLVLAAVVSMVTALSNASASAGTVALIMGGTTFPGPSVSYADMVGLDYIHRYSLSQCGPSSACGPDVFITPNPVGQAFWPMLLRTTFVADLPSNPVDVDCTTEACSVELVDLDTGQTVASAPISFLPNAAKVPPPAAVTPSTNVTDGEDLVLTMPLGYFEPASRVEIVECKHDAGHKTCGSVLATATTDAADGSLSTTVDGTTALPGTSPPEPCGSTCDIVVREPASTPQPVALRAAGSDVAAYGPAVASFTFAAPPTTTTSVRTIAAVPRFTG